MTDLAIELEWWRGDPGGYRLVERTRRAGGTLLSGLADRQERLIVYDGGELRPYHPLAEFRTLFSVFANKARNADGVLEFIGLFGPLTDGSHKRGEDVAGCIEHANAMWRWIEAERRVGGQLPQLIGQGISFGKVKTVLTVDPLTKAPRVRLTAESLRSALWLQLAQALSKGLPLQQCEYCGTLFETGPGSGRRLNAKFCSDQHRIAFNSRKRTVNPPLPA
jgi:hypothetical protein